MPSVIDRYLPVLLGGPCHGDHRVVSRDMSHVKVVSARNPVSLSRIDEGALIPPEGIEYEESLYIRRQLGENLSRVVVSAYVHESIPAEHAAAKIWEYMTSTLGPQP